MLPGDDVPVDCIYQDAAVACIRLLLIQHIVKYGAALGMASSLRHMQWTLP